MTSRQYLAMIKARAMRTGIWFKALSKVERAIMNLTIHCVETIRSTTLAKTIAEIIDRIRLPLAGFIDQAEKIGTNIAEELCKIGTRWGNLTCSGWKQDKAFIRFLGITAFHN